MKKLPSKTIIKNDSLAHVSGGFTQHLVFEITRRRRWVMARKVSDSKLSAGFTIIELLIATTVFSVVLLTALSGFLSIGRLFYQGVSTTQTAAVANQLFSDITGNFQTANNITSAQIPGGYSYYCVGNSRYTYNLGKQVSSGATASHAAPSSGGNYGLLKDVLPGSNACATPCDDASSGVSCPAGTARFSSPVELLGNNIRINLFSIQSVPSVSPNFYNISVIIVYGDDSLLQYTDSNDLSTVSCKGGSTNQQFCAVYRLSTGVYRGAQ